MATRKRLRPVAAPVDPFVTPANPGPEQSNQTWDGLLQLSNSLFQADAAYREAEERKKREARTQKAEERRERAQAAADAPVGVEVLADLAKKQPGLVARFNKGEATDEDRQTLISAFTEANISEPNNPALLGEIKKRQVMLLPSNGSYENTMLDPEFLDEVETLPEDEKQAAMQERKAAWIASQNVTESLRPVLLAELRGYDERVNSVLASRRLKQHEAQTNRIYTEAAGLATEAIVALDDERQAAAVQQIVSFHKSLSAADKTKAEKQLLGAMSERLKYEINTNEMSEDDMLEVISMLEDNSLLPDEDMDSIKNLARDLMRTRQQRARDPMRSGNIDRDAQAKLEVAITDAVEKNGFEPLTDEQLRNVVNGHYKEIADLYTKQGFIEERARSALNRAQDTYRTRRGSRQRNDPDVIISIDEKIDGMDPDALTQLQDALQSGQITDSFYDDRRKRILSLEDPELAEDKVRRLVRGKTLPAGVSPDDLEKRLVNVLKSSTGSWPERTKMMRSQMDQEILNALKAQPDEQRSDRASYWLAMGRAGRSGAILDALEKNAGPALEQSKLPADQAETFFPDVLEYVFSQMSESEIDTFRRLSEDQQQTALVGRILDLRKGDANEAFKGFLNERTLKIEQAKATEAISGATGDALRNATTPLGLVTIAGAYKNALETLGEKGDWAKNDATYDVENVLARFAQVKPGADLDQRFPQDYTLRQARAEKVFVRALALQAGVTDGVEVREYVEFGSQPIGAKNYLKSHFLNYGVPLESLVAKRHLGVSTSDLGFSWDSSPYFESASDLAAHIRKDEDGQWVLSDTAEKAFDVLSLNRDQDTIGRFYEAQSRMIPQEEEQQKFLKAMRMPDLDRFYQDNGVIKFYKDGGAFSVDDFRLKVMGAK